MEVTSNLTVSVSEPSGGAYTWNMPVPAGHRPSWFLNIAKHVDGWDSGGQAITAEGNLDMSAETGGGHTRMFLYSTMRGDHFDDYAGTYNVFWDGGTGVTIGNTLQGTTIIDSGTVQGIAQFSVAAFDNNRAINFLNIDASDPPTNVRIVRSDYQTRFDAGEIFDPEFITMMQGATHGLRFMDMMQTNGSTVEDWADYPTESWQRWKPVPISILCKMANEIEARPWFCVPHLATGDFITQMGTTINITLNAGLKAKVEWSNEVWNINFPQTNWCRDRAELLWPTQTNLVYSSRAFLGMRTVNMMNLLEAVSPTRFDGYIGGQAAGVYTLEHAVIAETWRDHTPDTNSQEHTDYFLPYEAPHTRVKYAGCADYFAKVNTGDSDVFMDVFDANGAGVLATDAFYDFCRSSVPTIKGYIDSYITLCNSLSLKFGTYEGQVNHMVLAGGEYEKWYLPSPWVTGIAVIEGEYRRNQFNRVYRAENAGVTGATEPTQTDGSTVADGTVNWVDRTGQIIPTSGATNEMRLKRARGSRLNSNHAGITEYVDGVKTVGQNIANSNGTIYEVTVGGSSTVEPTHTEFDTEVAVGGVTYLPVRTYLGDGTPRPEVAEWLYPLFYTSEMTDIALDLANYQIGEGATSPAVFTLLGDAHTSGSWGRFSTFSDYGPNRIRESGHMMRNWSMTTTLAVV